MQFNIDFDDDLLSARHGGKTIQGKIRIGEFEESFVSCLDFWNKDDYYKHWRDSLRRISFSAKKSCLITSLPNPEDANFIVWWPIYRIGDTLYFQNQCLFLNQLKQPFDCKSPYRYVGKRLIVNEDGDKISEWHIPVSVVLQFLKQDSSKNC